MGASMPIAVSAIEPKFLCLRDGVECGRTRNGPYAGVCLLLGALEALEVGMAYGHGLRGRRHHDEVDVVSMHAPAFVGDMAWRHALVQPWSDAHMCERANQRQ